MEKEWVDQQIDQRRHRRLNRQAKAAVRKEKTRARTIRPSGSTRLATESTAAPGGIDGSEADQAKAMARCLAWSVGNTLGLEYHRGTTLYRWARDLAERIMARHRSQA